MLGLLLLLLLHLRRDDLAKLANGGERGGLRYGVGSSGGKLLCRTDRLWLQRLLTHVLCLDVGGHVQLPRTLPARHRASQDPALR